MITRNKLPQWGNRPIRASFEKCPPSERRTRGYRIDASSYALFAGARAARRISRSHRHLVRPSIPLTAANKATIELLDRWLQDPHVDRDPSLERLRRAIDENCLSDRTP